MKLGHLVDAATFCKTVFVPALKAVTSDEQHTARFRAKLPNIILNDDGSSLEVLVEIAWHAWHHDAMEDDDGKVVQDEWEDYYVEIEYLDVAKQEDCLASTDFTDEANKPGFSLEDNFWYSLDRTLCIANMKR